MTIDGATQINNSFQVGTATTNRNSLFYGSVYIGSPTAYINNVSGSFHTNVGFYSDSFVTAGAAASSSDIRLKYNIESIGFGKAISLLNKLRGCE